MRAHWHIRRFTQNDLAEARRLLDEVVALDPTNSVAYSALARHFEGVFGWGDGPAESHARLGEAACRAVGLMKPMPPRILRWRSSSCSRARGGSTPSAARLRD